MMKSADAIPKFFGDVDHRGHFVCTVAMIVNNYLAVQDTHEGLHRQVPVRFGKCIVLLMSAKFAQIVSGLSPGLAITGDVAHASAWLCLAGSIDTFWIFTARHLQTLRSTWKFHTLHRSGRDIF